MTKKVEMGLWQWIWPPVLTVLITFAVFYILLFSAHSQDSIARNTISAWIASLWIFFIAAIISLLVYLKALYSKGWCHPKNCYFNVVAMTALTVFSFNYNRVLEMASTEPVPDAFSIIYVLGFISATGAIVFSIIFAKEIRANLLKVVVIIAIIIGEAWCLNWPISLALSR